MTEAPGELILYTTEDGRTQMQFRPVDGTVWLSQAQMAALFDTGVPGINKHISNILQEGELGEATISKMEIVRFEGDREVRREITIYNLEMILAVGYRVRSPRGVQFRQWATTVLSEYLVKGFAMNDERLKDPRADYFDELLQRIRDIRASEKRFYQKVRDVFATSLDYDPASATSRDAYAKIQNKLTYAITEQTSAELVLARADPGKPNMGLTSWKATRVRKGDIIVAKNYLTADEIEDFNRLTTQFLDFAEGRAKRRQTTTMSEWVVQTDRFIEFNELPLLKNAGKVSHKDMEAIVCERYGEFGARRRSQEAIEADKEDAEILAADEREVLAELERVEGEITGRGTPD
ncbi:virulence RhuM family protein [Acrocarpospora macrocephala]|uniref:2-hydroxyacid dehydrogenase n=1 Tax=Acrocarpospora macrocephala TaxID=150177 RepID=A0A5M3X9C7_9ACTN|nr:virulence RhuM family protein [Acrocarpospora macrocephala]GES14678.1 2-hydroxyacid dehydrogenase [Acrocarpospora macrocephala]